jgi:hypothetical protein
MKVRVYKSIIVTKSQLACVVKAIIPYWYKTEENNDRTATRNTRMRKIFKRGIVYTKKFSLTKLFPFTRSVFLSEVSLTKFFYRNCFLYTFSLFITFRYFSLEYNKLKLDSIFWTAPWRCEGGAAVKLHAFSPSVLGGADLPALHQRTPPPPPPNRTKWGDRCWCK